MFSNKSMQMQMEKELGVQLPKNANIMFIISDDMTFHDIGCYGALNNFTPNIDKIASEGMRFTRCFTATAMCAPMRSMTYTGIHPVRNGCYPNHYNVKTGTKSLVHYFKNIGYRVGLWGKTHIGPDSIVPVRGPGFKCRFCKDREFHSQEQDSAILSGCGKSQSSWAIYCPDTRGIYSSREFYSSSIYG